MKQLAGATPIKRKTMGTFYTRCRIENPLERRQSAVVPKLLVETGSEFTRVPEKVLEKIRIRREKKTLHLFWPMASKLPAVSDSQSYV